MGEKKAWAGLAEFFRAGDRKVKLITVLGTAGILLIFLSQFLGSGKASSPPETVREEDSAAYVQALQGQMSELIGQIQGAGRSTVLITLIRGELRRADSPTTPATRVIRYIEGHYGERLTLGRVADKLGFSLPYLSSLFKKECGMTFRDYLCGVRLKHGATLLRGSDLSIDAVARLVGYEDPAFFYKMFKKRFGMTPDAYRKA